MNEEQSVPTQQPDALPPDGGAKAALIAGGILQARRRFLTRGLVGGSVTLLAVARPVESLAGTKSCTWSAWKSATAGVAVSVQPACDPPGKPPSYYYSSGNATSHWPTAKYSTSEKFNAVFGSGASESFLYIYGRSSSYFIEYHFTTALFSAYLFNSSGYPYSTTALINLYHSAAGNVTTLTSMASYLMALE
jgi:hypothetical protein